MRLRRLKLPLLALLLVLTRLAPLPAPPSVSAQDEAEPVTVTVWLQRDDRRAAVDEDLIAQFMADNPEIEVVLETFSPMNYDAVLRTALAAGIGPDLFSQWTGEIGQYHAEGRLAPFDPEAAGWRRPATSKRSTRPRRRCSRVARLAGGSLPSRWT
ncbi:MAG: extracellular solute-binding protein [Anaerolineae bacterium]|nr:extracellular solute-binding protein [Anaerolineae bacterium]